MTSNKKHLVPCPECGGLSEFSPENQFRPFCSERCKLIDLGVWASEGYKIPAPITAEDLKSESLESENLIRILTNDD